MRWLAQPATLRAAAVVSLRQTDEQQLLKLLADADPFLRHAAIEYIANDPWLLERVDTGKLNGKGKRLIEWQNPRVNDSLDIPDAEEGMDIGPKTIRTFIEIIPRAKTILWNGPMGVFEDKRFAEGTFAVARAVADATQKGAT